MSTSTVALIAKAETQSSIRREHSINTSKIVTQERNTFARSVQMSFIPQWLKSGHEKRTHAEKTVKCDECDMMFYNEGYKNHHFKQVHIGYVHTVGTVLGTKKFTKLMSTDMLTTDRMPVTCVEKLF